jgi:hypothetical protein
MSRAKAPSHRPTWVAVLCSLMLLYAGFSLVVGLMKVRRPTMVLEGGLTQVADSREAMQARQRLSAARAAAVQPHERAIRIEAVVEIAVALLALYAAAAVLSRDRHGRVLTLVVAGVGIAYQVGTVVLYLPVLRAFAEQGADPLLGLIVAQGDKGELGRRSSDEIASVLSAWLVLTNGVVVLAALVVIGFFGGQRGRALYGLTPPPALKRPGG